MPDYIYLLESRLSLAQRNALKTVRDVARAKGQTVFLVGGAVRDLTSGSPVRDLDVVVQGSAVKLKKDLEKAGATVTGEYDLGQSLHLSFPSSVRMEFGSTLSVTFPKPGKPVMRPANILDDLRRRDFTVNAMALSLNEGSYGLLMDPLNGVADIENRQLRLVSNYGFIEDPVRMIRAARLMARLGWTMDEKTQARYDTGKQENYIAVLSDYHRGYETEEIVHEEDPLRIMRRLESEGWLKVLAPFWTTSKANTAELERLRDTQTQLQMQGMTPDPAAANFPLLTAKLTQKEVATLKAAFPRPGFVTEIEALEAEAKEFAAQLAGKGAAQASQAWKLISGAKSEVVLWTAFTTKSSTLQAKFQSFYKEWPQARQRMPYVMMQEMRIVPELPGYQQLLETLFFELMDGKLSTPEEMKAFLEPFSPPAPPPPVSMRRPRAAKKEAKPLKSRAKKSAVVDTDAELPDADVEETAIAPTLPVAKTPEALAALGSAPKKVAPGGKPSAAAKGGKAPVVANTGIKASVAKTPNQKIVAPVVSIKAPAKVPTKKSATPGKIVSKATKPTSAVKAVKSVAKKTGTVPAKKVASAKQPLKVVAKKAAGKSAQVLAKKSATKTSATKTAVAKKAMPSAKAVSVRSSLAQGAVKKSVVKTAAKAAKAVKSSKPAAVAVRSKAKTKPAKRSQVS